MGEPTGSRNHYGVKDSADCWRTIRGVRWRQWMCDPPAGFITALRVLSVRYRVIRHSDGSRDLFVHPADEVEADRLRMERYPTLA